MPHNFIPRTPPPAFISNFAPFGPSVGGPDVRRNDLLNGVRNSSRNSHDLIPEAEKEAQRLPVKFVASGKKRKNALKLRLEALLKLRSGHLFFFRFSISRIKDRKARR